MIFANVAIGLVQLVITIVFAVLALYIGLTVYSRIVQTFDAKKELLQGNVAVFIVVAAVFFAIAVIVVSGVTGLIMSVNKALETGIFTGDGFLILGIAFVQLILGIVLAIGAIWLALRVLEKLTPNIVVSEELGKGNVAIALEIAGVIIAVAVIIQSGVLGITSALG
ncbi:MAG: DUF350 domain-containing protein [Methanomicrobiales archaeon HGW-Methanomicrobiales-1]|jgi:uncharacterized membrane protein YjfL (UPF0719 family)|nr:MAG: DUF350 domain-containing protein [Methanomicrobiales archaeon HGW-Methanomicrobiales-1]